MLLLYWEKEAKFVSMKIPVMFMIGDNKGGDVISGQPIYYGKDALRISQTCDASCDQLEEPIAGKCIRIIRKDVLDLVEQKIEKVYLIYTERSLGRESRQVKFKPDIG